MLRLLRIKTGALSVNPEIIHTTPLINQDSIRTELPAQQYIQQLPKIQALLLYLEGKGRSPNTLRAYEMNLKALAQRADLNNTQQVELAIARYKKVKDGRPCTNNYKSKLCDHYATYCKFYHIEWEKPIYTPEPTTIQPPSQERVQAFIASARLELSIKLDISAQTGLRPVEVVGEKGLHTKDFHPDQSTITARITKGCNQRPPLSISRELAARLQTYITNHNLRPDDLLFPEECRKYGEQFRKFRIRLAKKLNDTTIRNIRLYDLRHYYCTKQLRRTQNAEVVRQMMGHKQLNTTQKYMHLLAGTNGEWIVEQTQDRKRAAELTDADYQYVYTTPDGWMTFRKPK
jgi:integrase